MIAIVPNAAGNFAGLDEKSTTTAFNGDSCCNHEQYYYRMNPLLSIGPWAERNDVCR